MVLMLSLTKQRAIGSLKCAAEYKQPAAQGRTVLQIWQPGHSSAVSSAGTQNMQVKETADHKCMLKPFADVAFHGK